MNTYTITYFHAPDVHTACLYDITYHVDVEANNYDEGMAKFKMLNLGYLWSIDIKE